MSETIENLTLNILDKIIKNIKLSNEHKLLLNKNKQFRVSRVVPKLEENEILGYGNEKYKNVETESKMIPADDYIRSIVFSLESVFSIEDNMLVDKYKDFVINPSNYIFFERINKYKELTGGINLTQSQKCSIDIRLEFYQNTLQYYNEDEKKVILFNYNYDFEYLDDIEDEISETDSSDNKYKVLIKKKENIEKFIVFCKYIIEKIENCKKFLSIIMTDYISDKSEKDLNLDKSISHRNIILVENLNNKIIFNHYEPHGSFTEYLKSQREEFFDILNEYMDYSYSVIFMNKKASYDNSIYQKIMSDKKNTEIKKLKEKKEKMIKKKIEIKAFNASYCIGIQSAIKHNDVGYCSLISFFWLYCVLTIYFELKKLNIQETITINKISKLFENLLLNKFSKYKEYKNSYDELYDILITFSYKLFERFISSEFITKANKNTLNNIQKNRIHELFEKYNKNKSTFTHNIIKTERVYDYQPKSLSKDEFKKIQKINEYKQQLLDEEDKYIKRIFPNLYKTCKTNDNCGKESSMICDFDSELEENICKHNNKKTLFSKCQKDSNCFSENCLNNKCYPKVYDKDILNFNKPIEFTINKQPFYEQNDKEFNIEHINPEEQEFTIEHINPEEQEFTIEHINPEKN
jgi:hypothetical protein